MELLKIEYQNKWYHVEKDSNGIKIYRDDGNKKNYDLSHDEMKLIRFSIDSITPSGNFIKLMDYKHNGNTYEVSMDLKTGLHYFNPIPNYKDLIELNMLFNNQSDYLSEKKEIILNKKKIKVKTKEPFVDRFIEYEKRVVRILVIVTLLTEATLNAINTVDIFRYNNYVRQTRNTIALSDSEYLDIIYQAVLSNTNLCEKEKKEVFRYLTEDFLLDNKKYIDYNYATHRLAKFKITYEPDQCQEDPNLAGICKISEDEIVFYHAKNLEEVNASTFSHELYHLIGNKAIYNNTYLLETINTIYAEEYSFKYQSNSYQSYINYVKALIEIVGPEPFRYYQFMSSDYLIIQALTKITGTEVDAKKLLTNLEDYKKIYDKACETPEENKEKRDNLTNLNEIIVKQIANYYYAKTNIDYHDDLVMLYYLDSAEFSKLIRIIYHIPDDEIIYLLKSIKYFNYDDSRLWLGYGDHVGIFIEKDNRYLNQSKSI